MSTKSSAARRLYDELTAAPKHQWGRDGFCLYCLTLHRTDFRPNDKCDKNPHKPETKTP